MVSRNALLLVCLVFGAAAATGRAESGAELDGTAGRELLTYDNSGYIKAKTKQIAANLAIGSKNVNQANVNQNAQAAGKYATAGNSAAISQANYGRKLQQNNSGYIKALTKQIAANVAIGSKNVNQANVNQNAQAAGYGATAGNYASISQGNYGRKLLQNNSGYIKALTKQIAANVAIGSKNVNQANVNQNAQAAGYGATAGNYASISQANYGRR